MTSICQGLLSSLIWKPETLLTVEPPICHHHGLCHKQLASAWGHHLPLRLFVNLVPGAGYELFLRHRCFPKCWCSCSNSLIPIGPPPSPHPPYAPLLGTTSLLPPTHGLGISWLSWAVNVFNCVESKNRGLRKQLALKGTRRGPREDPCSLLQREVTAPGSMLVYLCLGWVCACVCVCVWSRPVPFCLCPDVSMGFVNNKWFWLLGVSCVPNLWCMCVYVKRTHICVWSHTLSGPSPVQLCWLGREKTSLNDVLCVTFPVRSSHPSSVLSCLPSLGHPLPSGVFSCRSNCQSPL